MTDPDGGPPTCHTDLTQGEINELSDMGFTVFDVFDPEEILRYVNNEWHVVPVLEEGL
jgi:uncharacterized protein (DUF302 family)